MNNNDKFKFEDLLVYQKALDYIDWVYTVTDAFPNHETFRLTDQFRRAACSIALNIVDGEGGTIKEFGNFLRIARRSAKECLVCTTIAAKRKYVTEETALESRKKIAELSRMISGLKRSIEIQKPKKFSTI